MSSHKNLLVWQRSVAFVTDIYKILELFPRSEMYGLIDQIKRASISVPSNIAEGSARGTQNEQLHFFYIARGSLAEIETQLLIAKNLKFISEDQYIQTESEINILGKMLTSLIHSIKK